MFEMFPVKQFVLLQYYLEICIMGKMSNILLSTGEQEASITDSFKFV
jgi:UTP-glucose-1-phosphate uridylyltransferase